MTPKSLGSRNSAAAHPAGMRADCAVTSSHQESLALSRAMSCCGCCAEPWAACEERVPAWTMLPGSSAFLFQTDHKADTWSIPVTACACCVCCEMPLSWLPALCGGWSPVALAGQDCYVAGWEGSSNSCLVLPLLQCRTQCNKSLLRRAVCLLLKDLLCCRVRVLLGYKAFTPNHQHLLFFFLSARRLFHSAGRKSPGAILPVNSPQQPGQVRVWVQPPVPCGNISCETLGQC